MSHFNSMHSTDLLVSICFIYLFIYLLNLFIYILFYFILFIYLFICQKKLVQWHWLDYRSVCSIYRFTVYTCICVNSNIEGNCLFARPSIPSLTSGWEPTSVGTFWIEVRERSMTPTTTRVQMPLLYYFPLF